MNGCHSRASSSPRLPLVCGRWRSSTSPWTRWDAEGSLWAGRQPSPSPLCPDADVFTCRLMSSHAASCLHKPPDVHTCCLTMLYQHDEKFVFDLSISCHISNCCCAAPMADMVDRHVLQLQLKLKIYRIAILILQCFAQKCTFSFLAIVIC